MHMHAGRPHVLIAMFALLLGGCASMAMVTGQTEVTAAALQSETAATTSVASGQHRIVVAFNDMTGNEGTIILGDNSRVVHRGASLMGWSYSEDTGRTWTYGGKVAPPRGWSILWGDPAATTSQVNNAVVFISNLAAPDSQFPSSGVSGGLPPGVMGGACIARSLDGGKTFAHYQCVTTDGNFYDGASMASTPCGEIFAAFFDMDSTQIRVWRAGDHNAQFAPVADPFPNLMVGSHPRLRASSDGWLYAAVDVRTQSGSFVYMNRYRNGQWATPVRVTEKTVGGYPFVDLGTDVLGSRLAIRTGPQFSFDVGASSSGGNDAVRLLYTRTEPASLRLYVEGAACAADLTNCHPVPQWRSTPGTAGETVDAFNPSVAAWAGTMSQPPIWNSSFYVRSGASVTSVGLSRMYLGYFNGAPLGIPISLTPGINVCSDRRGYWGDYDDMLHVGFDKATPVFIRFTTSDHGRGCTARWGFVGYHQHVQSVREPQ